MEDELSSPNCSSTSVDLSGSDVVGGVVGAATRGVRSVSERLDLMGGLCGRKFGDLVEKERAVVGAPRAGTEEDGGDRSVTMAGNEGDGSRDISGIVYSGE